MALQRALGSKFKCHCRSQGAGRKLRQGTAVAPDQRQAVRLAGHSLPSLPTWARRGTASQLGGNKALTLQARDVHTLWVQERSGLAQSRGGNL